MKHFIQLLILISMLPAVVDARTDTISAVHVYKVKKATGKASLELPKMNVVYCGVANPMVINVPGYSNFNVKVSEGDIQKLGSMWLLSPTKAGALTVSIQTK